MSKAKRSGYFGSLLLGVVCALLCVPAAGQSVSAPDAPPAARQTPNTSFGASVKEGVPTQASSFGVLLGATIELEQKLERDAAKSARAAQAFGASLSAADRRELQGACTALVANSNDADASRRLEQMMARYRDNSAEAIMRFCLEPTIAQLRADLQASRQTLERINTGASDAQANIDLQNKLQKQQQLEQMISNVMKASSHDTAKNSISNVR